MKTILILLAVVILGFIGWKMLPEDEVPTITQEENTNTQVEFTPATSTQATSSSQTAVKTFTVVGKNFSFSPSTISVNKGDKVKIVFQNSGGTHDWVIDEFSASTSRISGGQSETIEFTADKSGSFEYYCSVGTHRQMGMKGTLIVK